MAAKPAGWDIDLAGSAAVERETAVVYSGVASLKYSNPDNATNSGWHGLQMRDPNLGVFCMPLRPGAMYRIKAASRVSSITGAPKYRLFIYHNAGLSISQNKEFVYKAANSWQINEWSFTVPLTAEPNSTLLIQFSRNGDAGSRDFWLDSVRVIEQEVGFSVASQLADLGRFDLIVNGDFEAGFSGWGQVNGDAVTVETGADKYKGAKSLKVPINSTQPLVVIADDLGDTTLGDEILIRVQPGERLLIHGAGKLSSATLGGTLNVVLRRYDHTKAAIIGQGVLLWATETAWTEKVALYSIPSDTYYIGIRIEVVFSSGSTGNGWIDELHIFRVMQRQVANDDFDNGNKGTNFTVDWNNGQAQRIRLTGSITISFSNWLKGATYVLRLVQDGVGTRTPTLSGVIYDAGVTPTWVTTANRQAIVIIYYDGATAYASTYGLNFNATT